MRRVRILRREEHRWLVQDLDGRRQFWFDPNARYEPVGQAALVGFGEGDLVLVDAEHLTPARKRWGRWS